MRFYGSLDYQVSASTLAHEVKARLDQMGCRAVVLDGDNEIMGCVTIWDFLRRTVRRTCVISARSQMFMEAAVILLTAFISPFREDRNKVRSMVEQGDFVEMFCQCPIEVYEQRDVKGMYKKGHAGEIAQFTGISSPYEVPDSPEMIIDTSSVPLDECVKLVISVLSNSIRTVLRGY